MHAIGRAREVFYACRTYAEIYEEAFGKPLSFKDPERQALREARPVDREGLRQDR